MALVKCPECGREVSEFSENCIGCGYPISKFLTKQKVDEEVLSVDIVYECQAIRKILSDFKINYVPLAGMRINVADVQELVDEINLKINSLSLESQKEIKGKFAESFCIGLCENNNSDPLNFADVKSMCDIIDFNSISEQSITNMTQTVYTYTENVDGASGIMALSWVIGELLRVGSESDKNLLESTLRKPNAFGEPRKKDVLDVVNKLKNESVRSNSVETTKKVEEFVPKCPTCQSTNIKKISVTSKAGSVALWGLFSQKVKKQWHCNSCGSEW